MMNAGWKRGRSGRRPPYPLKLLLFLLALWATSADAQTPATDVDPHPLRRADTSSPRATLNSFLVNANEAIEAWRVDETDPSVWRPYLIALQTLDFSTTPSGNSYRVRTRRFLFLKEILDRIELPPDDEIPGDAEVADGDITAWTIPNTSISISRIEAGPRKGEFLFSAGSVEALQRLYHRISRLPYRPGATPDIFQRFEEEEDSVYVIEERLRLRLTPADTSSPRTTLYSFLDSVARAHEIITVVNMALLGDPPGMTMDAALSAERQARDLLTRAANTLDLSEVPRALRENVGFESVLLLKEVLDRLQLPPEGSVPDARMAAAARSGAITLFEGTTGALRWRYPNSEIEIVEITEGRRKGQFLFSAATVAQIEDMYEQAREFPYRRDSTLAEAIGLSRDLLTPDFYKHYISQPGYLVHQAHYLSRFIESLPGFFSMLYLDQAVWQWIGLLLGLVAIVVPTVVVYRAVRRLAARSGHPWGDWLMILPPIVIAVLIIVVVRYLDQDINITGTVFLTVRTTGNAIVTAVSAWIVFNVCRAVAETAVSSSRFVKGNLDATLWRVGSRVVGFLLGAWIVIDGAQELGADMVPLIAGLGVGGLAVALAAQKTIANFIGSLILFANKPVRVGDFCRYGDEIGTVESIGLHSTRIRSLERTVVTVPNAEFSDMKLDNYALRDQRLLKTILQLRYETTPDQMRYILVELRELLLSHPMVTPEPARVRFVGYGNYSKDLEVFAYLRCQDQNTFLAMQEDVLLRMEDIVVKAGSGFAFPSQTAYLARDAGLDAEQRTQAELEVQHLRVRNKLPFPEFDDEERERLEDTLDYPPKGSPESGSRVGRP